jgi:hypothetical protein
MAKINEGKKNELKLSLKAKCRKVCHVEFLVAPSQTRTFHIHRHETRAHKTD